MVDGAASPLLLHQPHVQRDQIRRALGCHGGWCGLRQRRNLEAEGAAWGPGGDLLG